MGFASKDPGIFASNHFPIIMMGKSVACFSWFKVSMVRYILLNNFFRPFVHLLVALSQRPVPIYFVLICTDLLLLTKLLFVSSHFLSLIKFFF
jgi:hypothetical protein